MFLKTVKVLAASVLFMGVNAQKAFDEDGEVDPKLVMNRASPAEEDQNQGGFEPARTAVRSTQAPLLDTFRGTTKKVVGDGIWKERGVATLWYDQEGQIISVDVENTG